MLQGCFPGNNKVQTIITPILMPDKNTRELRNNVNPTSKKLEILGFHGVFMFRQKTFEKWEKNDPSWACPCRIEKSHPRGRNLTRDSASLVPGWTSDPSGEISLSYMDAHGGLLYSILLNLSLASFYGTSVAQCRTRSDDTERCVWPRSPLFAYRIF